MPDDNWWIGEEDDNDVVASAAAAAGRSLTNPPLQALEKDDAMVMVCIMSWRGPGLLYSNDSDLWPAVLAYSS
jgi:hypothetical protein